MLTDCYDTEPRGGVPFYNFFRVISSSKYFR
jgi:hypothetical protein